jgi:hypothetical protein
MSCVQVHSLIRLSPCVKTSRKGGDFSGKGVVLSCSLEATHSDEP